MDIGRGATRGEPQLTQRFGARAGCANGDCPPTLASWTRALCRRRLDTLEPETFADLQWFREVVVVVMDVVGARQWRH